MSTSGAGECPD